MSKDDPMEAIVRRYLAETKLQFVEESDPQACGLDFYLVNFDVHIEVKQFHSPRIASQTAKAENVIVLQGKEAVYFFVGLLLCAEQQR